MPQTSPASSSSALTEPDTKGPGAVHFVRATTTPTLNPAGRQGAVDASPESRAFEDGLPLAARVNDQPLFLATYEEQVKQYEQALREQGFDLTSNDAQAMLIELHEQVLEGLLDQLIIEQQAQILGVTITEAEIEAKAQETIAKTQHSAEFPEWLNNNDLTYEEFLAILQSQLIASQVYEHVTEGVPEAADQIQLQYFRVGSQGTAQAIIAELEDGIGFGSVVRALSLPKQAKSTLTAGNVDWFPRGAGLLPTEVEAIAFALDAGEISGPIQAPDGVYIIRLEDIQADRRLTSDRRLLLKKQIFDNWLMEQRSLTVIETYVTL